MKTDLSMARLNELLADGERTGDADLRCLKLPQAMDNLTSTLLDCRAYYNDHQLKLLSYLLEMAILESIEVQLLAVQDDRAHTSDVATGPLATEMEFQNEQCGDDLD